MTTNVSFLKRIVLAAEGLAAILLIIGIVFSCYYIFQQKPEPTEDDSRIPIINEDPYVVTSRVVQKLRQTNQYDYPKEILNERQYASCVNYGGAEGSYEVETPGTRFFVSYNDLESRAMLLDIGCNLEVDFARNMVGANSLIDVFADPTSIVSQTIVSGIADFENGTELIVYGVEENTVPIENNETMTAAVLDVPVSIQGNDGTDEFRLRFVALTDHNFEEHSSIKWFLDETKLDGLTCSNPKCTNFQVVDNL